MEFSAGDAPALRSHGHQLRSVADDVRAVAERLEQRLEAAEFKGPAAERLRDMTAQRISRLRGVAHDFEDLSQVVTQSTATST